MNELKNLIDSIAEHVIPFLARVFTGLRGWWIEYGNARNYSKYRAGRLADHRASRANSWTQLRYTPNGFKYGGIVSTGAVS